MTSRVFGFHFTTFGVKVLFLEKINSGFGIYRLSYLCGGLIDFLCYIGGLKMIRGNSGLYITVYAKVSSCSQHLKEALIWHVTFVREERVRFPLSIFICIMYRTHCWQWLDCICKMAGSTPIIRQIAQHEIQNSQQILRLFQVDVVTHGESVFSVR